MVHPGASWRTFSRWAPLRSPERLAPCQAGRLARHHAPRPRPPSTCGCPHVPPQVAYSTCVFARSTTGHHIREESTRALSNQTRALPSQTRKFFKRRSGFEVVHGAVERAMLMLGPKAEGFSIRRASDATYLEGRCAEVLLKCGRVVGSFGALDMMCI
jgi:hypothetical protein